MTSRRAAPIILLVVGLLLMPHAAEAQRAGKSSRIGILTVTHAGDAAVANNLEALRQGLRERGWVEGENIAFEYR